MDQTLEQKTKQEINRLMTEGKEIKKCKGYAPSEIKGVVQCPMVEIDGQWLKHTGAYSYKHIVEAQCPGCAKNEAKDNG